VVELIIGYGDIECRGSDGNIFRVDFLFAIFNDLVDLYYCCGVPIYQFRGEGGTNANGTAYPIVFLQAGCG
jgi:hypothetical protein